MFHLFLKIYFIIFKMQFFVKQYIQNWPCTRETKYVCFLQSAEKNVSHISVRKTNVFEMDDMQLSGELVWSNSMLNDVCDVWC